jgi:hypothetical protein
MGVSSRSGLLGRVAFGCVLSVIVACGGGSSRAPTQPTPSAPAVPSNQWALKGRVVETLTDAPIGGAKLVVSLTAGSREVTSADDGSWEISQASVEGTPSVEVSAEGYITRRTYLRWATGTRGDIVIDLIKDAAPFALAYYRELVRNHFEEPDVLQPLRRLTKNPNFYIHKHNPRTGTDIPTSEFESLVSSLREGVRQMSGGQLEAGRIEHGSEERAEQSGFITVTFVSDPDADWCGRARVGADPGLIIINHGVDGCSSRCGPFAPRTVVHEVGHALGYWHVAAAGDIMNTAWYDRTCGTTTLSTVEGHHARIAYRRPPGNLDTDWDPVSAALLKAPAGPPLIVSCR